MIKQKLHLDKSTKNTHVYKSDEQNAAVSPMYVQKSSLPKDPPKVITHTIEWEDK